MIEKYGIPENHTVLKSEFERIFPTQEYGSKELPRYLLFNFFASSLSYLREFGEQWLPKKENK